MITLSVEKPGLAFCIRCRLCKSNPVPARRTKLSETWTSTNAERNRDRPCPPMTPAPSLLNAPIHLSGIINRDPGHRWRKREHERVAAPIGDRDSAERGDQRKQHALGEE